MARKKRAFMLDRVEDFGHAYVRDRSGRLVPAPIGASDGVVIMDIPDITRPDKRGVTVRVARRDDPLLHLLDWRSRTGPDASRMLAAEKLRDDAAIADGLKSAPDALGVSGGGGGGGPTIACLYARGRVREALEAVRGPENDAIAADAVQVMVLGYGTLEMARRYVQRRAATVKAGLFAGLDRLARYYGLTGGNRE